MKGKSNKRLRLYTDSELTELWRPHPAFVGPSMPPMIAWQRAGEPRAAWQISADARAAARIAPPVASDLFAWAGNAA